MRPPPLGFSVFPQKLEKPQLFIILIGILLLGCLLGAPGALFWTTEISKNTLFRKGPKAGKIQEFHYTLTFQFKTSVF